MGYKCTTRPSKLMLAGFKSRSVGVEMIKWKRKLKEAFGMEGGTKAQTPLNRREQVDKMLEEAKSPVPRRDERIMQGTDDLGLVHTHHYRRRQSRST